MGAYGVVFVLALDLVRHFRPEAELAPVFASAAILPFGFGAAQGAAAEALHSRAYFFVSTWTWYEWMGIWAPLGICWWLRSRTWRHTTPAFRLLLTTMVPLGLAFTFVAVILTSFRSLENFARLQPMRSFHIIYVLFFLILGGLAGEYVLRGKRWRWIAAFVPLCASMFLVQRVTYASSSHIEWPGAVDRNHWNTAFIWVRDNTPKDALFTLDPDYLSATGEDSHGFRAVAERSALDDNVKDSGATSMFPSLADEWKRQVSAQRGGLPELRRLYPVTWIVTAHAPPPATSCLYRIGELSVCRLTAAAR